MNKIISIAFFLFYICILQAVNAQVNNKEAGVCFRVDDYQPIEKLKLFDSLFRAKGLKFTYGCNAQIIERIGGASYWALLKDMQNYGHDIADHSPNHYSHFFEVTSMQDTSMYAGKSGVDHINKTVYNPNANGPKVCLKYNITNPNGLGDEGKIDLLGNKIISRKNGEFSSNRIYGTQNITKFFIPSLNQVVSISNFANSNVNDPDTATIQSFWNEDVNYSNMQNLDFKMLSNFDIEIDKDGFLLMQQHTQYLFAKNGLKHPTTWLQPGGDHPYLSKEYVGETIAKQFEYSSAATYPTAVKTYNEFDPYQTKNYAMQWGDFYEESQSISNIKNTIADRMARRHLSIGLNHFSNFGGFDWATLVGNMNELLDWCKAKNVKVETYHYWADAIYKTLANPNLNIAPNFNIDIDENGLPDGFNNANIYYDTTTGVAQSGGKSFAGAGGQLFTIQRLGAVEKGKNILKIFTKGGEANDRVNIFINVQDKDINYYFDFPVNTNEFTEYNKEFWLPDDAFLISIYCNAYSMSGEKLYVSGLDVRGAAKPKILQKRLHKLANEIFEKIDLDNIVYDANYTSNQLTWVVLKNNTMANIDTIKRELNILPKQFWVGKDSLIISVTNPIGECDTATLYFESEVLTKCEGESVHLNYISDSNDVAFKWISDKNNIYNDSIPNPLVKPTVSSTFTLFVTKKDFKVDTLRIDVNIKLSKILNDFISFKFDLTNKISLALNTAFGNVFYVNNNTSDSVYLADNMLHFIKKDDIGGMVVLNTISKTCNIQSTHISILKQSDFVSSLSIDNNLKVYPNPTENVLNIEVNFNKKLQLIIVDINGKQLKNTTLNEGINKLDMSDLKQGFYLLYVRDMDNTNFAHYKLLKN